MNAHVVFNRLKNNSISIFSMAGYDFIFGIGYDNHCEIAFQESIKNKICFFHRGNGFVEYVDITREYNYINGDGCCYLPDCWQDDE